MKLVSRKGKSIIERISRPIASATSLLPCPKDDLPKQVRKAIKKDFEDVKIYEIEEVQHPTKGLFYDVEFKIDGKKKDIEFNGLGQIISN
jgi:hypothetical protein